MILNNFWSDDVSESDKSHFFILSNLYEHHENLLHRLFNPNCPALINPHLSTEQRCHGLSSGEKILLKIGLDIWDGSGGIHFNELYQDLDPMSFQKILLALLYLRSPGYAILF